MSQPPVEVIRCPVHGIPDCSPLLNGCTLPNRLALAWAEGVRYCHSCQAAPCRFTHPPLDKNR